MSNLDDLLPPNFNASKTVESAGDGDYSPLPAGWYAFTIEDASLERTKAGNGHYIELVLVCDGPTYAGRKVWDRLNIDNPNLTAREIGLEQFSRLSVACGYPERPRNLRELVGCKVEAKLAVDAKDQRYEPKNVVKAYRKLKGSGPAVAPSFNDSDIPF